MRNLILLPLLLIAFQVKSQDVPKSELIEKPKTITLKEAVTYALENKAEAE